MAKNPVWSRVVVPRSPTTRVPGALRVPSAISLTIPPRNPVKYLRENVVRVSNTPARFFWDLSQVSGGYCEGYHTRGTYFTGYLGYTFYVGYRAPGPGTRAPGSKHLAGNRSYKLDITFLILLIVHISYCTPNKHDMLHDGKAQNIMISGRANTKHIKMVSSSPPDPYRFCHAIFSPLFSVSDFMLVNSSVCCSGTGTRVPALPWYMCLQKRVPGDGYGYYI